MTLAALRDRLSARFEWIVQKVRDYPKGFLILSGVMIVLAKVF